jgi:hypothetical protein
LGVSVQTLERLNKRDVVPQVSSSGIRQIEGLQIKFWSNTLSIMWQSPKLWRFLTFSPDAIVQHSWPLRRLHCSPRLYSPYMDYLSGAMRDLSTAISPLDCFLVNSQAELIHFTTLFYTLSYGQHED